jgi:type 1 glutamine amidotransferase
VDITTQDHPVTQGLAAFEADDELYTCLAGDRPITVLATAKSKATGKDHPMAFVFDYGQGRVFHTPLGHDVKAFTMVGPAELIRRGCAWAAHREVTTTK